MSGALHRVASGWLWTVEQRPAAATLRRACQAAEITRFDQVRAALSPLEFEVLTRCHGLGRRKEPMRSVARSLGISEAVAQRCRRRALHALHEAFGASAAVSGHVSRRE
jgi:hypothetical protein